MTAPTEPLLRYLRRLTAGSDSNASDAALLERFVSQGDEGAFTALLSRHGPMVLGVCRRILRNSHDAEDAFQATFLVLARKAGSLRRPESLASWLYRIARHLASSAQRRSCRRRQRDARASQFAAVPSQADLLDDLSARELLLALDEEIARLPETYRLPLILRHLEGRKYEEAARLLGWTTGSVKGRLERGRKQLHARLRRRGLELSGVLLTLGASFSGSSGSAASLASTTLHTALAFGRGDRSGISATVLSLAEMSVPSAIAAKTKVGLTLLLAISLVAGSGALVMRQSPIAPLEGEQSPVRQVSEEGAKDRPDLKGDPLPPGAVARMGAIRLRHIKDALSVAFSPDGKILATTGDRGGPIILWDATTGRELRRLSEGDPPTQGLVVFSPGTPVFSPDGKRLAACGWGRKEICLWDVTTGKNLPPLKVGISLAFSRRLAFSPNGKVLAVPEDAGMNIQGVFGNSVIHLVDAETGKEFRQLKGNFEKIESLAFSPDGKILAAAGDVRTILLWETATGRQFRQLLGHEKKIPSVAFSADGKQLASASHDGTVRLWDAATGAQQVQITFEKGETPYDSSVQTVLFVPGTRWLTAGGIASLRVWNLDTGREIRRLPGHWGLIDCPMAVSPDGKKLAATWEFGQIRLTDLATGKRLCEPVGHQKGICSAVFSPDGKTVVSGSGDHTLRFWDAVSGRELRRLTLPSNVRAVFSADGKYLIGNCMDSTVRIWNAATGEEQRRFPSRKDDFFSPLAFSPDRRMLASTGPDNTIRLWGMETGAIVHSLGGHPEGVRKMDFSPDGKTLVSLGWAYQKDKTARLWDVASGKAIRQFTGHRDGLHSVAFSPDGKTVAAGGRDNVIYLWDADTGAMLRQFVGSRGCVESVRFSPDGRTLASGENLDDFSIRLWEVATGQERVRFSGHRHSVDVLDFSRDGRRLISAGYDGILLVWDATGRITAERHGAIALTEKELTQLWTELGDTKSAARACQAMRRLLRDPAAMLRLFRERLHPVPAAEMAQVAQWIADLDSAEFAVREKAMRELERRVEAVEGALRKVLDGRPSLEVRQRVRLLLGNRNLSSMDQSARTNLLRGLRAIELLEVVATTESRRLLQTMASGSAEARLTQEAKASLVRLTAR